MHYSTIPSAAKFQSDSSVAFAFRKDDIVLRRIDELLEHRAKAKSKTTRFIFLSDLYFTTDYWLKIYPTNPLMRKERQPAVHALFAACAHALCAAFGCTINGLPRELEFMWGRNLTACGASVDFQMNKAEYITRAEAKLYRLRFKAGRAYMMPWYRNNTLQPKLEPAESRHAYVEEAQTLNGLPAVNYGFFVLTMSRDLYMFKHRPMGRDGSLGFFHSSYVAGDPIACSGTMLIEHGVVRRVRLNSGHYQPHLNNARTLIMALRMWAVPLKGVVFEDFKGYPFGQHGSAEEVVAATNDWGALKDGRNKSVADAKSGFAKMPKPDLSKSPNPRDWWGNRPGKPEVFPPAVR